MKTTERFHIYKETLMNQINFLGDFESNPFELRHYNISNYSMFVNGKQIPSHGLSVDMGHEKTSVMAYRTLFEGSGIHHSNGGLQITHDMFIKGFLCCYLILHQTAPRRKDTHHTLITVLFE
jgi:hypothetical protein